MIKSLFFVFFLFFFLLLFFFVFYVLFICLFLFYYLFSFTEIHEKLPTCACFMSDTITINLRLVTLGKGWMDDLQFYVLFNSISMIRDDGCVIMKGRVQCNPVYFWKDSRLKQGSNIGPLDQQASAYFTEIPGLLL